MSQFIRFYNTLINLNEVSYAWVTQNTQSYKFQIIFATPERTLVWTKSDKASADLLLDEFTTLVNQHSYVILETP